MAANPSVCIDCFIVNCLAMETDYRCKESRRLSRSSEATKPRLLFRVVVWLGVVCYGGISVAMLLLFPIFTFDKPEGAYGIGTDSDSFWVRCLYL